MRTKNIFKRKPPTRITHKKIVKIICKILLYAQDFILEWMFNLQISKRTPLPSVIAIPLFPTPLLLSLGSEKSNGDTLRKGSIYYPSLE